MFIINLYLVVTSHCISDWDDENVIVCMLDFVCVCVCVYVWIKYRWGGGLGNEISDLIIFLEALFPPF